MSFHLRCYIKMCIVMSQLISVVVARDHCTGYALNIKRESPQHLQYLLRRSGDGYTYVRAHHSSWNSHYVKFFFHCYGNHNGCCKNGNNGYMDLEVALFLSLLLLLFVFLTA